MSLLNKLTAAFMAVPMMTAVSQADAKSHADAHPERTLSRQIPYRSSLFSAPPAYSCLEGPVSTRTLVTLDTTISSLRGILSSADPDFGRKASEIFGDPVSLRGQEHEIYGAYSVLHTLEKFYAPGTQAGRDFLRQERANPYLAAQTYLDYIDAFRHVRQGQAGSMPEAELASRVYWLKDFARSHAVLMEPLTAGVCAPAP